MKNTLLIAAVSISGLMMTPVIADTELAPSPSEYQNEYRNEYQHEYRKQNQAEPTDEDAIRQRDQQRLQQHLSEQDGSGEQMMNQQRYQYEHRTESQGADRYQGNSGMMNRPSAAGSQSGSRR